MDEIWKTIPGYEYHQVSNLGRVRSLDIPVIGHDGKLHHIQKGRIRKPMDNGHGYKFVRLRLNGKSHYIHRLVMEAFYPEHDPEKSDVNHKDGDKSNNRLDNLEWCTMSGNMLHAYKTGLRPKGETHQQAKLSFYDVCEIRDRYSEGETQQSIADRFCVSRNHVGRIVRYERRVSC